MRTRTTTPVSGNRFQLCNAVTIHFILTSCTGHVRKPLSLQSIFGRDKQIFINSFPSRSFQGLRDFILLIATFKSYHFSLPYHSRQRGRVVRALDVQFGGPEFKQVPPRPLAGFVLGSPEFKSSVMLVNSQLVCLWPDGIISAINTAEGK